MPGQGTRLIVNPIRDLGEWAAPEDRARGAKRRFIDGRQSKLKRYPQSRLGVLKQ